MTKPRLRIRQVRAKHRHFPRFGKELLILLAMIIAVGTWKIAFHEFIHKKTPPASKTAEWKRYSPGGSHLSLMLPGEPQQDNADVPDTLQNKVKQISRYKYFDKQFQVAVWDISYFDSASTDIQQAADGARQALRQSEGVAEYQDSSTPIARSGRPGLLIRGTFRRYGEEMELEAILLGDGPRLWQVIITHPASDSAARAASNRVLDSVNLEYT